MYGAVSNEEQFIVARIQYMFYTFGKQLLVLPVGLNRTLELFKGISEGNTVLRPR